MSYIIITINILEYFPISFNYEDFKFIFSHNKQVFGDEISFISKNKIIQKIKLEQKDINFSVKVIKMDSLIGICNFILSYKNILLKKIPTYEKECLINMTDSTKRILSINNINLKIKIYCEIKYIDKDKDKEIIKNNDQKPLLVTKNKKINNSIKNKKFIYTKKTNIQQKELNQSNSENNEENNINIISHNNKNNNSIYNKPRNYSQKKLKRINVEKNDSMDMEEEELSKNQDIIDEKLYKFVSNLIKENPLENLARMNDIDEMMLFTKNNIIKFLNYQKEINHEISNVMEKNDDNYKLLEKYSQKYLNNMKKLKILEKKQKINDIKHKLYKNNLKSNIYKIIEIKNNEINLFKEINNSKNNNIIIEDEDIEDNLNINEINNNLNNNSDKDNKKYNILIDLLKNCILQFGNNEKIMKIIPKNIIDNFNSNENDLNSLDISLVDNDENIIEDKNNEENKKNKLKYIESNVNDEIDFELDNYLKEFYENNENVRIIKFKKVHDNNYNYGKIQIIVIEEGNTIKIKDDKGIFSINEFLELNSSIQ